MKFVKFLLFLLISEFAFSENMLTKEQCLEDFEELKIHLTEDSVSYDNIVNSGRFDYEKSFSAIYDRIKALPDDTVSEDDFFNLIYENLRGIPDHHIGLVYKNELFALGWHETFFIGKSEESINVPVFSKNEPQFLSGVFRKQSVFKKEHPDEFNSKFKEICITAPIEHKIITTEKQMYIRIPDFSDENSSEALERFVSAGKIVRNKEFVVIDLTGNKGGDLRYTTKFLCNFFDIKYSEKKHNQLAIKVLITKNILNNDKSIAKWAKAIYVFENIFRNKNKVYLGKPFFKGKNYILKSCGKSPLKIVFVIDKYSASAAESFIYYAKNYFENIVIVGENSMGVCCYGNVLFYELRNSRLLIQIPYVQLSVSDFYQDNLDSDFGILPDYWCASKVEVINTLQGLGVDNNLLFQIKDFYEID